MVILRILTMFIVAGGDLEDTLEVFLDYDTEEKIMKYVQRTIESDKRDDVFSSGVKNGRIK